MTLCRETINKVFRRHFHLGKEFNVEFEDLGDVKKHRSFWAGSMEMESGEQRLTAEMRNFCGGPTGIMSGDGFNERKLRAMQMLENMNGDQSTCDDERLRPLIG